MILLKFKIEVNEQGVQIFWGNAIQKVNFGTTLAVPWHISECTQKIYQITDKHCDKKENSTRNFCW